MANTVITIARHFGSGGKTIGQMLAKELGIPCYGLEIIHMASEESGINESLFNEADERLKKVPLSMRFGKNATAKYTGKLIQPGDDGFVSDVNLFNYQAKVIKDLAAKESCVIIGRAADYVLRDCKTANVVSVFVHASKDYCVKKTVETHAYSGRDVEKYIAKIDHYRSDYYMYYTGQDWHDARNYDLCLNSERLGFEGCVKEIKSYINIRFGE